MTSNPLDRLYGAKTAPQLVVQNKSTPAPGDEDAARLELIAEAAEPTHYRAFLARVRPVPAFALIEADGTLHGFQYHTVRHPKHQQGQGGELLSFVADGLAVVIEGKGLAVVFRALLRHTLYEVRAYDGRSPVEDDTTRITRLEVAEPSALAASRA